ncbi:MAG: hypothetical protein CVT70_09510 [Alphaproteobacteria bacterium HGW-Alphaproteobacteria-1]|jgi:hypothetical protein|nr:MAG: hypothetical protein CVT70_09510 [Alphaproteobacteria bacterium HGW-Alphaproteobacteria-1]
MKPNFALNLSLDGITLLHLAAGADQHVVGAVALDTGDLAGELAALRQKAQTLAPSGTATKLIIPEEQIRYLDLPAASAPHGDYDAAAADALDGATPYALHDLAFDWTVAGDRLQVAAVARETLEEAESFALEHGFNPVSFVAQPDTGVFAGEPFFGPTDSAGDHAATPAPVPTPEPVAKAEEEEEAEPLFLFASIRAERGGLPVTAPKLDGAARFTPAPPLPETAARTLSGVARASLAPQVAPSEREQPEAPSSMPSKGIITSRITAPPVVAPESEAERLTIFGARQSQAERRGKPRFLGLILTAALLLLMVGVAALASIFPDSGLGRLLRGPEPQIAVTPDIPELADSAAPEPSRPAAAPAEAPGLTPPTPVPAPEIVAAPEVPAEPQPEVTPQAPVIPQWTEPRSPEEARARYAATGIWPTAPMPPNEPASDTLDALYQTSIDEALRFGDAVALPAERALAVDARPPLPARPPQPGQTFALDARGLVTATPEGALTPSGVIVRAGLPPLRPETMPVRAVPIPDLTPTPEALAARERLSGIRPRPRPENLSEQQERGALGGRSRSELATLRPRLRPATLVSVPQPDAEAIQQALDEATEQAVAASLKPRLRPQSIERAAVRAAPAAPVAPAPQRAPAIEADDGEPELTRTAAAAPRIPTSASIAQQATTRNAINLRQVNLIGVYGAPSNRRALVRLANGRYQKVQVGDRIDGGRVSAIGNDELRYRKGSRDVVLRLPKG